MTKNKNSHQYKSMTRAICLYVKLVCPLTAGIMLMSTVSYAQPAKGASKFLGNITTGGNVRSDFNNYWNQITPENESKWASVEGSRDVMNWGGVDRVKNYAEQNNIPWKFHTLIWGSQHPGWIMGLSQSEQLAEITEWFDEAAKRYPDVDMIDVVNEAYDSHAPAPFKNALGGNGSTGFDWIIKSFQMARQRWPKAILIYNDYNNIEYGGEVAWTVKLIEAMKKANAPVDAIGCQAHDAWKCSTSQVKSNLDKLAATGLPIYITEYDIGEGDDAKQKQIMQEQFTMFWNHPKIVGVTYWGYVVGSTWRSGTGLLNSSGAERPSLTWLVDYVKKNLTPPNDFKLVVGIHTPQISFTPPFQEWSSRGATLPVQIIDLQGRKTAGTITAANLVSGTGVSQGYYIYKHDAFQYQTVIQK
jgi:endo-1,4-beta-xylanase